MSVFRWTAPLFKLASRRWSPDDFATLARLLRPYVPPGGSLLDLGGGTGELGVGVGAILNARVVVADATSQMLARVDAVPHVSVRLARAESLPFTPGHFDAVLCSDAFHHFRDQSAAAAEIARVLRPGGGVVLIEPRPDGVMWVVARLERLLGEPGIFLAPSRLKELFAIHGIHGTAQSQGVSGYVFIGTRDP